MEVHKAYRFRIYPTKAQQQDMLRTIGACRWVYNHYLEERKNYYLETKKTLPFRDMSTDLTRLRRELGWLGETQSVPLQQSIRYLDVAFNRFFRKEARFPCFKSKKDPRQSYCKARDWSIHGTKLKIQNGMRVRTRGALPPKDAVRRTLTISVTSSGRWYASAVVIQSVAPPDDHTAPMGVDLGLIHLAITSDGQKFDNLTVAKRRARRMKLLQQSLSRKQKGSHRREKAKLELARLHEKIANQRMNWLHQVSSAITGKNHALIAVEDLSVVNMLKNRHLSRSISDVSWSELLRQIEYKQHWRGGEFVKVDRFFPSSKTCSNCYYVMKLMPLKVREWTCPNCGADHDRDINAAKNILKQAGEQLGVESTESNGRKAVSVTGSTKRGHVQQ